jgi:GxxExxY protein
MEPNDFSGDVITAAMRVHTVLGPGMLESAYVTCLALELRQQGLRVATQVQVPIVYGDTRIDVGYRLDMLVEDRLVVELKAVAKLLPVHQAQLLSYLRLGDYRVGLLLNFCVPRMREGIVRIAN